MIKLPENKVSKVIITVFALLILAIVINYFIYLLYNNTTLFDNFEKKNEILIKIVPQGKCDFEFEYSLIKGTGVKISKKVNQDYIYEIKAEEPLEIKSKLKREWGDCVITLEIWDNKGLKLREYVERNDDEIKVDVDFKQH